MKKILTLCALLAFTSSAFADAKSEEATQRYLASIMNNPEKIQSFMNDIPKGGDLHNHASGSTFAEKMIEYAANDNMCINRTTFVARTTPDCPEQDLLNNAIKDPVFYDALVDAWSMQHFVRGKETGHDHFFSTFSKFGEIAHNHLGEILAEIADRAANQHEIYVETMVTADDSQSGRLGKKLGWDPNLVHMRAKLLANGFDKIVASMTTYLDSVEAKMRKELRCGTAEAKAGCDLTLRYQYQVKREQAPEMVFAQLLAGFEGARKDKRIVGLNMVMPEDGPISMRDYELHMQMVRFLHSLYPDVHITLHAGELNEEVSSPDGLSFHIRDAVTVAHAERIGHGVDLIHEKNYTQLLQYMAEHHIMVEINLSSNEGILNIQGKDHPLSLYLQYGVPVALSTDDEGVTRDIMTTEYVKALTTYKLDYMTFKNMVRNSIEYAFVAGDSLWSDKNYQQFNLSCQDTRAKHQLSSMCSSFIKNSEKAALQMKLEQQFDAFEQQFVGSKATSK